MALSGLSSHLGEQIGPAALFSLCPNGSAQEDTLTPELIRSLAANFRRPLRTVVTRRNGRSAASRPDTVDRLRSRLRRKNHLPHLTFRSLIPKNWFEKSPASRTRRLLVCRARRD